MPKKVPQELAELLKSITSGRAKVVVEHILKYGSITSEELKKTYKYDHPPRAARDVREKGIPLETFYTKSREGRRIAAYKFGDLTQLRKNRLAGRRIFTKEFKRRLYDISGGKCAICNGQFDMLYLQIDHRIPYEVSGEPEGVKRCVKDYMLLCASCNRAKSWSCEHCPNWLTEKLLAICSTCYWANPEDYTHIALREVRRVDILWEKHEIQAYEKLKNAAQRYKYSIPDYVKKIIARCVERNRQASDRHEAEP